MKAAAFPAGDGLPTNSEIAAALASAVPEAQRAEATAVLVNDVLSVALRDVSTFVRPRALAQTVYDGIAQRLHEMPPEQRLEAVRGEVLRAEIAEHRVRSLALAIRRYLLEHPKPPAAAEGFLSAHVAATVDMNVAQVAREATERKTLLEAWRARAAADHPAVWREHRRSFLAIGHNLGSAASGSFEQAAGSLYDFLVAAGGNPGEIRDF